MNVCAIALTLAGPGQTAPRSATGPGPTKSAVLMRILVLNAGSSSIKLRLLDANDAVELSLDLGTEGLRIPGALEEAVGELEIEAVGHRVVHGGSSFSSAEVITDEVQEQIASLKELAPLHQAASLEGIRRSRRAFPTCRMWPASTRPSTPTCPRPPRPTPYPCNGGNDLGCDVMGFTASRMPTRRGEPPR